MKCKSDTDCTWATKQQTHTSGARRLMSDQLCQLDTDFQGSHLIIPGISIRTADSLMIPEKVTAAEAHNEDGMRGCSCLPWPESHSWRMVMVSTVNWHELMSRNLQHIYGAAAAQLQSSDDGLFNKWTGKPQTPPTLQEPFTVTEFPGVTVVPPCWKTPTAAELLSKYCVRKHK